MERRTLVLMLWAGMYAAPAQQAVPNPSAAATDKTTGILEGRVENSKTGEPVRRVNLTLRPSGQQAGASVGPMVPAAPYVATTDAEGKFRIEKVEPGNYFLMAERQGFVRQTYGGRSMFMMGTTITVTAGAELKTLHFRMIPHAVLTGRVLDEEGEPLARTQVQVLHRRYFQGKTQLVPTGGGQSNDNGEFRIADIAPGRYWIAVVYYGRQMFGDGPARNTAGQPEEEYVTTYYPSAADEPGAQPLEVEAGQQLSGLDVRMRKSRVYRISGKVTGSGTPQQVRVMLMPRTTGVSMAGFGRSSSAVKADGTFEVGGAQTGSYNLVAMSSQGMMSTMGQVAVDVGRENVEGVVLTLGSASTVRGGIRVDGSLEQLEKAQGKKITFEAARIQLAPIDGIGFNAPNSALKPDGSFVMENAGAQKYRVSVYNLPAGLWVKAVRSGDQDVTEQGLDLSSGGGANVEVVLGTGAGQISGAVQDGKQKPAPGSMVTLIPDPMLKHLSDRVRLVMADQNGQFTLKSITPGEYKLYAWEDVEPGSYSDPEFLKPHDGAAKKMTVKADGSEQVTVVQVSAEATKIR
ncbi:MAG: carboxypeptidase regulatory-like domain-containing protein [Acidobacteria bacterium]|nr:carboxypeptidase regulatory-like domain-containing protein [Acidobacteriota bacterium]